MPENSFDGQSTLDNKPFPEPVLAKISNGIRRH